MKRIIIKSMHLTNFKGVRDLSIDFNDTVTNIYGRNGAGKTTVFDAFMWLLFGKDSQDRKAFELRTLDTDGNIIAQLPHEVSAVLEVNGQEIRLMRRFTEKWVKRAGKVEKEYDGNKEERFFNDVPCSKSEYEEKIADLCREDIFKFITSPTYFCAQKPDEQKKMLHRMAGNITDAEVAGDNEDFKRLLDEITGKTLTEYKKEIAAKKSRINAELVDLPGRIDEKKRDIARSEEEDWSSLEAELKMKRERRDEIEQQLDDINAQQRALSEAQQKLFAQQRELQAKINKRESEVTEGVMRGFYTAQQKKSECQISIDRLKREISIAERSLSSYEDEIKQCEKKREQLIEEWKRLNARQKQIQAEQIQIDEAQFICPTCHRRLDLDEIETKEAELLQNFEQQRGERLATVAEDIARNKRTGIANNERKQSYIKLCDETRTGIEDKKKRIEELEKSEDYTQTLVKPDASAAIASDALLNELRKQLEELTQKQSESQPKATADTSELKDGRAMLTSAIEDLVAKLSKRINVEEAQQRIEELEKQMQTLNADLAELERTEFVIAEFSKARSEAIEARIDGLFRFVRFRWLKVAINGAVSETCEATLNGKPYGTCSNAERINIGLDIINAICKSEEIFAPIFIDNAESVNDILPMQSQTINLIVSRDESLRIETANK